MSEEAEVDYGPLAGLIGKWSGDKGLDIAPEVEGQEESEYYETLEFSPIGLVTNVDTQDLAGLYYRQVVQDKADDEFIHNQTGYLLWDADNKTVINSFTIPRGLCTLAAGSYNGETDENGRTVLTFKASHDDPNWTIIQSPFMSKMAKSLSFDMKLVFGDGFLRYEQMTLIDIFGRNFEHTEHNELTPDN